MNEQVAQRWHRYVCGVIPWPATVDDLPLAEDFRFVGPPMSFDSRYSHFELMAGGGADWVAAGGTPEIITQYGSGEWFTSIFSFHSGTSDQRVTSTYTSQVIDGLVRADYCAYDARVAYNQVDDLTARLHGMLSDIPGATYGLP